MELLTRIKCALFGHKYVNDTVYNANVQKIKCERCLKYFGMNHDLKILLPWDQELDDTMKLLYPEKFQHHTTEKPMRDENNL